MIPPVRTPLTFTVETAEIDSPAICVSDGVTDDYECWDGELPEVPHEDEGTLYAPSLRGSKSK